MIMSLDIFIKVTDRQRERLRQRQIAIVGEKKNFEIYKLVGNIQ